MIASVKQTRKRKTVGLHIQWDGRGCLCSFCLNTKFQDFSTRNTAYCMWPSWPHHTNFTLTTFVGRIWKTQTLMKNCKLETTQVLLNFYCLGKNKDLHTYVAAMLRCCQGGPCCCCPLHPGRVGNDGHCRLHTPHSHRHCPPPEPHTPPQTLSVLSVTDTQNEHFQRSCETVVACCAHVCKLPLPAGTKWWPPPCVWHLANWCCWQQGWHLPHADLRICLQADLDGSPK